MFGGKKHDRVSVVQNKLGQFERKAANAESVNGSYLWRVPETRYHHRGSNWPPQRLTKVWRRSPDYYDTLTWLQTKQDKPGQDLTATIEGRQKPRGKSGEEEEGSVVGASSTSLSAISLSATSTIATFLSTATLRAS